MKNYFTESELRCQHTGIYNTDPDFLAKLNAIRHECGFPFVVTSGYRHNTHPIEAKKTRPGAHATGRAVDIAVYGKQAHKVVEVALKHGMTGIGVQQKGAGRFIHLDDIDGGLYLIRPTIWSY